MCVCEGERKEDRMRGRKVGTQEGKRERWEEKKRQEEGQRRRKGERKSPPGEKEASGELLSWKRCVSKM
jgi:hypothetical protein